MELHDVTYAVDEALALITLNRPQYRNAQSYRLLDELDSALATADADPAIKVIVLRGSGGNFSSGHDLGTPESLEARALAGVPDSGIEFYENFRRYNLDLTLRWRNVTKPTIAMVEGYCIYGGWMIAASMDLVFAASDAKFLAGLLEYFSVPFDVGIRKAKELCFESRFITADEAKEAGFVSRIYAPEELERETLNYARRCAENTTTALRMSKLAINKIQDAQGYSNAMEGAFADYFIMMGARGGGGRVEGMRRLGGVDLAVKGTRRERAGQSWRKVPMPELTRPTVTLHYEDTLDGEQAIVFLHGWCDGSPSWATTIADFKREYRCVAPDMRGHGQSGQPRDYCYSLEALTNDIVALCEHLGVSSPILVGHSYGGMLAAVLASRFPGFARAVVVEDQPLDFRPFATQMRSLEAVIRGPESHMPFREQLLGSMMTEAMPAEAKSMLASLQRSTPSGVGMALWAALFEFSPAEMENMSERAMAALALQPSALIDASAPPDYYATLRRFAPEARVSTLGGGHWTHLEKPQEFRSALRAFLAAL